MTKSKCIICSSSNNKHLYVYNSIDHVICLQCGLIYENRQHSSQANLLSRDSYDLQQAENIALARFNQVDAVMGLQTMPPNRCLELGCGAGSFLRLIRGAGWDVTGIEDRYLSFASTGANLYQLPIGTDTYEEEVYQANFWKLVVAFQKLEYVENPKVFLQKIHTELIADGYLYLEVLAIDRLLNNNGSLDQFFSHGHCYSFSKKTLCGLLESTGFVIDQSGYTHKHLWVLARKVKVVKQLDFPLENPDNVIKRLTKVQKQTKLAPNGTAVFKQANALIRKGIHAYQKNPQKLWAGVARKKRRIELQARNQPFIKKISSILLGKPVVHYGMHVPVNAGDTVLFETVRRTFEQQANVKHWRLKPLWEPVTSSTIAQINREAKAIVIGGGGVFLKDTNPNSNSGWQWNCSNELLREIEVPIILFGVGYNRFRGQGDFDSVFTDSVQQVVDQSVFIGLRNAGSIQNLFPYLREEQRKKLAFQPCPTTNLGYLYPQIAINSLSKLVKNRRIALNMAFDRHDKRFGVQQHQILQKVARAMCEIVRQGWKLDLMIHTSQDAVFKSYLYAEKVPFREVDLYGIPHKAVLKYYQNIPLAVGMRGHSQMIPFGLGGGIISLISHNKLQYFLDDIGHPEWGVEIQSPELEHLLIEKVLDFAKNTTDIEEQIRHAQASLWKVTQENLAYLKDYVN